jgi:signal transduction histidine kinase
MTGGIAHDFNNLLTVIQGNLQVLEEHASQVPMLVYGPPSVALRMQDLTRHPRGRRYRSVSDIAACGELVDAISQRAEESFPATTLGL